MTFEEFKSSVHYNEVPKKLNPFLLALWHDANGNWNEAHNIVQEIETADGSWMHAYLHRKEGDESNARYWYNRAYKQFPKISFNEEWEELVRYFLKA